MKEPRRLFRAIGAWCREDQGPKPQGPPGHPGTELALPNRRRRPPSEGIAVPVRMKLETAAPSVEVRNARPSSILLLLKAGEVWTEVVPPVPLESRLGVEYEVLEHLKASQADFVLLGGLNRRFRVEPCVGVGVVVNETETTSGLHAGHVAELRALDVVALGVAFRRREGFEKLLRDRGKVSVAEATSDKRYVGVSIGHEVLGLLQDALPLLVGDDDAEVLPGIELVLDLVDNRLRREHERRRIERVHHSVCQAGIGEDAFDILERKSCLIQEPIELLTLPDCSAKVAGHGRPSPYYYTATISVVPHI